MTQEDTTSASCTVVATLPLPDEATCELLAFHQTPEGTVSGQNLTTRGRDAKASMTEDGFERFWRIREQVPMEHAEMFFLFPETLDSAGDMRYASRNGGKWAYGRCPIHSGYGKDCALVRFS